MSGEPTPAPKGLGDIARSLDHYPEGAYNFVREGLEYAARAVHGPMTPEQYVLSQYMAAEKVDLAEVFERHAKGTLDPAITTAIEQCGGPEKLNRNVCGADLCWSLRDLALRRWGMLARVVLKRWNITRTADFGQIVFTMVEAGLLQKEPHDAIEHFGAVYDFDEALNETYRIIDSDDG